MVKILLEHVKIQNLRIVYPADNTNTNLCVLFFVAGGRK